MATEPFDYRRLPGVVPRQWAEEALDFDLRSEVTEAGLVYARCPLCAARLRCRILPGELVDVTCEAGCAARLLAGAIRQEAESKAQR